MNLRRSFRTLLQRSEVGADWIAGRALRRHSHLREAGWFRSFRAGMPVDAQGMPLPWYTYSSITFIAGRLQPSMSVFEYGSGNSTLWWSRHVAQVSSCEHDPEWHATMRPKLPANAECVLVELAEGDGYASTITHNDRRYDVVVIDGRHRNRCARFAPGALSDGGVIVWDNSDRPEYREGFDLLTSAGFRRIDFWGMGPINAYTWCTSVFYRSGNCFGI